MHIGERIAAARKAKGWSQGRLGEAVHQGQTTISSWERGRTEPGRDDVENVAQALGISRAELEGVASGGASRLQLVPVVGRVGADASGTVYLAFADATYDMAPLPPGGTSKTVALEVNGSSMPMFADDGSLIYFEDQKVEPTPDLLGEVCAVETEDGRVLVKRLKRGSAPGLYDLESIVGPTIHDVRLRWAAEITNIVPPRQARRIIVRAEEHAA
jgi:transcriptional regulator with XRE-family HTH domain